MSESKNFKPAMCWHAAPILKALGVPTERLVEARIHITLDDTVNVEAWYRADRDELEDPELGDLIRRKYDVVLKEEERIKENTTITDEYRNYVKEKKTGEQ